MRHAILFLAASSYLVVSVAVGQQQPAQGTGARRSIFEDAPPPTGTAGQVGGAGAPVPQPARPRIAMRVAYVVDVTAAARLPLVKSELCRALTVLKPGQAFAVVASRGGVVRATAASGLSDASPEEIVKAVQFVGDIAAEGGSAPGLVAALEAAFARGPQLIYVLTDGRMDADAVADRVREMNRDGRVKINLILFTPPGQAVGQPLKRLPAENGGLLKHVEVDADAAGAAPAPPQRGADTALRAEVAALRAEVAALRAELAAMREERPPATTNRR